MRGGGKEGGGEGGRRRYSFVSMVTHTQAKARHAMEAIWQNRDIEHQLVGTTINIHNGQWTRKGDLRGVAWVMRGWGWGSRCELLRKMEEIDGVLSFSINLRQWCWGWY